MHVGINCPQVVHNSQGKVLTVLIRQVGKKSVNAVRSGMMMVLRWGSSQPLSGRGISILAVKLTGPHINMSGGHDLKLYTSFSVLHYHTTVQEDMRELLVFPSSALVQGSVGRHEKR